MGSYIKAPQGAFLLAVNYSTCTGKYSKGNQSMAIMTTPAAGVSPYQAVAAAPTVLRASADGTTVLATAAAAATVSELAAANANTLVVVSGQAALNSLITTSQPGVFDGANVTINLEEQNFNTTNQVTSTINSPSGSTGEIQYNSGANSFASDPYFTYTNSNVVTPGIRTNGYFYGNGAPFIGGGNAAIGNFVFNGDTVTISDANQVLNITGNGTGNVNISANSKTWTFANNGTLTAPGNISSVGNVIVAGTNGITVGNINNGNNWQILGDTIRAPGGARWQSTFGVVDTYLTSVANGFIDLQSIFADSNIASEVHLEHGLVQITAHSLGSNVDFIWSFDNSGNLTLPSNTSGINYANGSPYGSSGNYSNSNVSSFLAAFGSNTVLTTGNITAGNLDAVNLVINSITSDDSTFVTIEDGVDVNGEISATGNITGGNIAAQSGNIIDLLALNVTTVNIFAQDASGINLGANGFNNLVVLETDVLVQNVPLSVTGNITAGNLDATNLVINSISSDDSSFVTIEDGVNITTGSISSQENLSLTANAQTWTFRNDGIGIVLPYSATIRDTNNGALAIGYQAGFLTQGNTALAVGYQAALYSQGANAVAIGFRSGGYASSQGASAVAVGASAGQDGQGNFAVAIGHTAGANAQGQYAVAIGNNAGSNAQGINAVAIGPNAGNNNQGGGTVAIGYHSGEIQQGTGAVAVGADAGANVQGDYTVAVGLQAGNSLQGDYAVAVGFNAGYDTQGVNSVAIGSYAGQSAQGNNSIIINATGAGLNALTANTFTVAPVRNDVANIANIMFYNATTKEITYGNTVSVAGNITAGNISTGVITLTNGAVIKDTSGEAVAFGQDAGLTSQGNAAVAIGTGAGYSNQGLQAVAIGGTAGATSQGAYAVAIGAAAGAAGNSAVAIGVSSGFSNQGNFAVAIGASAGATSQGNNSIILNATGAALDQTTANTFTVAPVRNDVANIGQVMFYNTTSKEITYGNTISVAGNITGNYFIGNGSQLTSVAVPSQTILPTIQTITAVARSAGLFGGGQGGANVTVANNIPVTEYGVIITAGTTSETYKTGALGSIPGTVSLTFSTGLNSTQYTLFAYVTSNAGTYYSNAVTGTSGICLLAGTQIALSDGTHKAIEDITYTDKLLSWDFDRGCYAETTAMWIKRSETGSQYNLLTFSDGTTLRTFDQHRIFNKQAGAFTYPMTDATPVGTVTVNEHGQEITLTNKQVIQDTIEYYNVITDYHMNLFSDTVLTSCRFNNIYPITDMKFAKDGRTLRTRAEFENIEDRFFHGLRLAEQTADIETVEWYVNRLLSTEVSTHAELAV